MSEETIGLLGEPRQDGLGVSREEHDREIAAMTGELRDVTMDVGSFTAMYACTNEQRLALARLAHRYRPQVKSVYVQLAPWGLPKGYVGFTLHDAAGDVIVNGGIDEQGSVST